MELSNINFAFTGIIILFSTATQRMAKKELFLGHVKGQRLET